MTLHPATAIEIGHADPFTRYPLVQGLLCILKPLGPFTLWQLWIPHRGGPFSRFRRGSRREPITRHGRPLPVCSPVGRKDRCLSAAVGKHRPGQSADTNIIIAAVKGVPSVRAYLQKVRAVDVLLSPIVLGELEFGAEKSACPERNRARL